MNSRVVRDGLTLTSRSRPLVMGIINVTPDSFFDASRHRDLDAVFATADAMVREGASILDIGGESTRPGSSRISVAAELDRVVPVIEALHRRFEVALSVDTGKAAVMHAAVAAGATLINDVYALRQDGALQTAAELGVPVCLVHMQGDNPADMQQNPAYDDVLGEVSSFLADRINACEAAGIPRDRLIIDPGFGFGKELAHNLTLLRELTQLTTLGLPVLVGLSRKSMIGAVTGRPVEERLHASVALAVYAALKGAAIVRVHDVGPTVDALRMIDAVERGNELA